MAGARRKPYHFTAAAFVVHRRKVLLVRHRKLGIWLPPGGHMLAKNGLYTETPEDCAKREVLEETGIKIEITGPVNGKPAPKRLPLRLPLDMHVHSIDAAHDHFGFDYAAKPVKTRTLNPLETSRRAGSRHGNSRRPMECSTEPASRKAWPPPPSSPSPNSADSKTL